MRTKDASYLRSQIVNTLGIKNNAIINQVGIKALSLEVFERTFVVTSALNVLTLGVASFAILIAF